jgi:serine/threonine protein kinase
MTKVKLKVADQVPITVPAYTAQGLTYTRKKVLFAEDRSTVLIASQVVPCPEEGDGVWREQQLVVMKVSDIDVILHEDSEDPMGELTALWHTSQPGHRNVVRLLNFFQSAGGKYLYIVLPYVAGGDLLGYRHRLYRHVGLPEAEAKVMMRQTIHGLLYLKDKGLAHGDLSPENLALDGYGNVVVLDLGMCRVVPPSRPLPLDPTDFRGKRAYAPIETWDERRFDPWAADVFSLGATFFELLRCTGVWERDRPQDVPVDTLFHRIRTSRRGGQAELSEEAKDLLCAMLHPDYTQRPTLKQILCHPWLQEEDGHNMVMQ